MRKQKSSSMKIDDDFTTATKRLVKKTLIIFGIVSVLVLILAFVAFKKITSPKEPQPEVASATEEIASPTATTVPFEFATPLPTITPTPMPSTTSTPSPSASASITPTPTTSPTATPKSSPTSTPAPTATPQAGKLIPTQANLDGYQSSNAVGSSTGEIKVGRNNAGLSRGFLSFDLSALPPTINKVVLKIYQQSTIGSPYVVGSEIKVDHLNFGSTFEPSDYSTSSISSSFATISNTSAQGWKEVDVTQQVKADKTAGRTRSQFRLHLAIEQPGGTQAGDYALFESGDNTLKTGNIPQLVVQ